MTGGRSPTLPAAPSEHGETCSCTRCRGFQPREPGPGLRHGAYSALTLAPRAREHRDRLSEEAPFPASGALLDLAGTALARCERGALVLAAAEAQAAAESGASVPPPERLDRLSADLRGWIRLARDLLGELGMTPAGRARILRDAGVGKAAAAEAALRELSALEGEGRRLRIAAEGGRR